MPFIHKLHDSQFDSQVAQAREFVGSTLGLPIGSATEVTVVPPDGRIALARVLGRMPCEAECLPWGEVYAVAGTPFQDPKLDRLMLVEALVHEIVHKATLRKEVPGVRGLHPLYHEAVAGMGAHDFLAAETANGRRVMPRASGAGFGFRVELPGEYIIAQTPGGENYRYDTALIAAWGLEPLLTTRGVGSEDVYALVRQGVSSFEPLVDAVRSLGNAVQRRAQQYPMSSL